MLMCQLPDGVAAVVGGAKVGVRQFETDKQRLYRNGH